MTHMPQDLQRALNEVLGSIRTGALFPVVERLTTQYRRGDVPTRPILSTPEDAIAYATYRMPATYAAVRNGLARLAALCPDFRPRTLLDVGGGTGAAVWAAAERWPGLASAVVLEQSEPVISTGQRLATGSEMPVVRQARWTCTTLAQSTTLPSADLAVMSYVLGELPEAARKALVPELARAATVVALFEPGTPAGYERIVAARTELISQGMTIAVPCPHDRPCPITPGADWCHFAARVHRTSVHRQVKAATLGYEDEKFSYVVGIRGEHVQVGNRIVRHPLRKKGLVEFRLCTRNGELANCTVSRRQGDVYRAARHADWGDAWPP